jgi:hypothetical protein
MKYIKQQPVLDIMFFFITITHIPLFLFHVSILPLPLSVTSIFPAHIIIVIVLILVTPIFALIFSHALFSSVRAPCLPLPPAATYGIGDIVKEGLHPPPHRHCMSCMYKHI